jgi:hypothetical protein
MQSFTWATSRNAFAPGGYDTGRTDQRHTDDGLAGWPLVKVVEKHTRETCIDCHTGIAHKLSAGYDEEDEDD